MPKVKDESDVESKDSNYSPNSSNDGKPRYSFNFNNCVKNNNFWPHAFSTNLKVFVPMIFVIGMFYYKVVFDK